MKPLFISTNHCLSKQHCKTCRSLDNGRQWRENLKLFFSLPDDKIDFICPYGFQWNSNPVNKINNMYHSRNEVENDDSKKQCAPCKRKK